MHWFVLELVQDKQTDPSMYHSAEGLVRSSQALSRPGTWTAYNWISQAIDILFEQTDFSPIVENKAWLFFGLSKTVISLFCSQNYWKLISNTALYGAQIYKPFLNAINGAIERTQNEKKRNIWHIWSFPVLIFPKKADEIPIQPLLIHSKKSLKPFYRHSYTILKWFSAFP